MCISSKNLTLAFCGLLFSSHLLAQTFALDLTFGKQGKYEFKIPGQDTDAESICLQQDGKIVTLIKGDYSTGEAYVIRQLPNGLMDATFGQGGKTTIAALPERRFYPKAVKMQPDGKIIGLVWAEFSNWSSSEIVVFRLLPSGHLDPDFGYSGIVRLDVNDRPTSPANFALQPDGKILLASTWEITTSKTDIAIVRLNTDGGVDATFGNDGMFLHSVSTQEEYAQEVVFHGEHLFVTGFIRSMGDALNLFLLKVNKDGALDLTFGTNGQVIYAPLGAGDVFMRDIAVLPEGKILVAGDYGYALDNIDFMLVRFKPDGKIDNSFGSNGLVHTKVEGDFNNVGSMLLPGDGKIILAGTTQYECWCPIGAVARLHADGKIDTTFGEGGKKIVDFGVEGSFNDAVLESDGSILLTGNIQIFTSDFEFKAVTCRLKNNLAVSTTSPPSRLNFAQIAPNPVQQNATTCHLALDEPGSVVITLTDRLGRAIWPVFNDDLKAGMHQIPVSLESGLPNGVYFLEIRAGKLAQVVRLVKM